MNQDIDYIQALKISNFQEYRKDLGASSLDRAFQWCYNPPVSLMPWRQVFTISSLLDCCHV